MANRYANLVGSNKIKDEYQKINQGFDAVEADMDQKADAGDLTNLQNTVNDHIGAGGAAHAEATTSSAGFMAAADKQKLDGVEAGAQVNQNAFAKVNDVEAADPSDELTITGGTGITVTTNPNTKEVIVTATGQSTPGPHGSSHLEHGSDPIPYATETDGGLMTAEDKQKLTALDGLPQEVTELKADFTQLKKETVTGVYNVQTGFGGDIQAAINAANVMSGGGKVYLPDGVYNVDETITLYSNIHLELAPNAVIDASGIAPNTPVFTAVGSVGAPVNLTIDTAIKDLSISVADESGFASDDLILISSDLVWRNTTPKAGELQFVKSVEPGKLNLKDGVWDTYLLSDNAKVQKITPVENIRITGGTIKGGGTGLSQKALSFAYVLGVTIEDVVFQDFEERCVELLTCAQINIHKNRVQRVSANNLAYGVVLNNGCHWAVIQGNHFEDCRHAVAAGGSSSAYGINRFVVVDSNTVYGTRDAGLDAHASSQFWTFSNNTVTCADASNGDGILFQGVDGNISGNTIVNPARTGIFIQHLNNRTSNIEISNNKVINPGTQGIYVKTEGANSRFEGVVVNGNNIRKASDRAIYLQAASAIVGYSIENYSVVGNVITESQTTGIHLRAQGSDMKDGVVSGNVVEVVANVAAIHITADEGRSHSNVAITGNRAYGGNRGIYGQRQTNCFVTGNIASGTNTAIAGFTSEEAPAGMNLAV